MLITFLCFSAISPMMAQDIKGKIVDEKGQSLAFANVVLLSRQDSAFVKGVVSGEDGHFAIDSPCNNGIIKVTSVGYKTVWKGNWALTSIPTGFGLKETITTT